MRYENIKRERDDSTFNLNFHPLAELYNFIINFPAARRNIRKNLMKLETRSQIEINE